MSCCYRATHQLLTSRDCRIKRSFIILVNIVYLLFDLFTPWWRDFPPCHGRIAPWLACNQTVCSFGCVSQCSRSGLSLWQHFTRRHQHLLPAPSIQWWGLGQRDQRSRSMRKEKWEKPSNGLVVIETVPGSQPNKLRCRASRWCCVTKTAAGTTSG